MATTDSKEAGLPTFERYEWAQKVAKSISMKSEGLLHFAEHVEAIASGSQLILEIAEASDLAAESSDDATPYFSKFHTSTLVRMVQINMELLANESDRLREWAFNQTDEGKVESYRFAAYRLKASGQRLPSLE